MPPTVKKKKDGVLFERSIPDQFAHVQEHIRQLQCREKSNSDMIRELKEQVEDLITNRRNNMTLEGYLFRGSPDTDLSDIDIHVVKRTKDKYTMQFEIDAIDLDMLLANKQLYDVSD